MTQLKASAKHGLMTDVDEEDIARLEPYTLVVQFLRGETPYVYLRSKGQKQIGLSRFIVGAKHGDIVDHINGDTLNNKRSNLRICTAAQNQMNRKAHGVASKYRGVTWGPRQKKWRAAIQKDRKQHHIGYFMIEEDAARAWDARAKKLYGEFARFNFP